MEYSNTLFATLPKMSDAGEVWDSGDVRDSGDGARERRVRELGMRT